MTSVSIAVTELLARRQIYKYSRLVNYSVMDLTINVSLITVKFTRKSYMWFDKLSVQFASVIPVFSVLLVVYFDNWVHEIAGKFSELFR